jgi:hypothetical protein
MKWIIGSVFFLLSLMAANAANPTSTKILALSEERRNAVWTAVLKAENCDRVIRTMYQGGTSAGDDSWSVGCQNGSEFSVGVAPDATGSIKVLTCKELATVDALLMARAGKPPSGTIGCWIKYK